MVSSTPVTVTVCAEFQFAVVKFKEALFTVAAEVSPEDTATVMSALG